MCFIKINTTKLKKVKKIKYLNYTDLYQICTGGGDTRVKRYELRVFS